MNPSIYRSRCPECDFDLQVEDPARDEVLVCEDCGLNLAVVALDPVAATLELRLSETRAEDWGE